MNEPIDLQRSRRPDILGASDGLGSEPLARARISVVIPALNEADQIAAVVRAVPR